MTSQEAFLAGHCPVTGRYFEPCRVPFENWLIRHIESGIDVGNIIFYFLGVNPAQVSKAMVNLLEYCLMSGWDWWDVIVTLKHQQKGKSQKRKNF